MIVYSVVNYRGRADMGKNNRYMSNNEKEEGEIMIIMYLLKLSSKNRYRHVLCCLQLLPSMVVYMNIILVNIYMLMYIGI